MTNIMKYILKPHAKERMKDRSISERLIAETIANPTKILYDSDGRILFKKLHKKRDVDRLLLMVGESKKDRLEIITVIETSKVKKYL